MNVAVIGAGIIGLSSAYIIKKEHPEVDVTVFADKFTPNTTSDGAAGYLVPLDDHGTPRETINSLARSTLQHINKLLASFDLSATIGLSTVHGYFLFEQEVHELPDWADVVYNYHVVKKEELNRFPAAVKSAHSFSTVCIESTKYIPWLMKEFTKLGGRLVNKNVNRILELFHKHDIIVNCAGLGAKLLADDDKVFPIRGQVALVKAPWIKEFYCYYEADACRLILPTQDFVVLGGTFVENDYNTLIDLCDKEKIMKSTQEIIPSLKHAEFIRDWVGLRPGRKGIRLEVQECDNGKRIIHNYGHTASGITLHWGCAEVVLTLFKKILEESS